tara:strand:+ start:325 stop:579 length:255 start_codon:yes stop_codon:yes gene_type:complete
VSDSGKVFEWRVSEEFCPNEEDSGSIVLWIFSNGAKIDEGDVVAEFMVQKITHELLAPTSGHLDIKLEPEIEAFKGDLLALIHM